MTQRLTQQVKQQIIENYYQTPNCVVVAKKFNIHPATIRRVLKDNDIKLISQSQLQRKYTINEHYFDVIDNEHKAYWLGLLYADGTVSYNKFRLELAIKDRYIIDRFSQDLETDKPKRIIQHSLKNIKWQDSYELTIHSEYMFHKLESLGCKQNKTFILKFPTEEQVPIHLINHFIRGYFDGDGCLTLYKNNGYFKNTLQIDSTDMFLSGIKAYLSTFSIAPHIYIPTKSRLTSRQLIIRKRLDCYNFGLIMYKNATIGLKRKFDKFLTLEEYLIDINVITHRQLNQYSFE